MQFDTTKLPESQWLTRSEAITYVAFGEAVDKEALVKAGLPSDQTHGAEHQQLLEQCRKEAARDPAYSEFLHLVDHNRPTLAQLVEHQGPMPPSAHPLRALLLTYDHDRAEEDRMLAGAAEKIREAGKDGKLIFRGYRYGQPSGADPEVIDAHDIGNSEAFSWTTEILKVRKPHREWDHVHVERASLVQWLLDSHSAETAPVRPKRKRGAKEKYDYKAIKPIARRLFKKMGGANETALIVAIQADLKAAGIKVPARGTLQPKLIDWKLY